MPDDNLFPDHEPDEGARPPAGNPGSGNGQDHGADTPLTMSGAAELISQAQAPLMQQIRDQGEALSQLVSKLGQPQNQPADPVDREAQEDFLTQFSENPERAIGGLVRGEFKQVVPLLSNLMNSATSAFVGIESTEIDKEFGNGAWSKFFEKPLNQILDQYRSHNAAALSDRNTITREVNGLKGQLLNDLVDFREVSRKAAREAEEGRTNELVDGVVKRIPTNLTGGLKRTGGVEHEVTEDLRGYLAERERVIGERVEPKDWLKKTDFGNTLSDYLEHQKKMKEAR